MTRWSAKISRRTITGVGVGGGNGVAVGGANVAGASGALVCEIVMPEPPSPPDPQATANTDKQNRPTSTRDVRRGNIPFRIRSPAPNRTAGSIERTAYLRLSSFSVADGE